MASKRPTDIELDTTDYKVRGEDGKYRTQPDRGLNRIGSVLTLCFAGWLYFVSISEWMPWYAYIVVVAIGFAAGATFIMSLKHIDW